MKNITPRGIALIISAVTAIITCIILLVFRNYHSIWYFQAAVTLIIFLLTFLLCYYFLEKFIYRKIKLIYKTIYNLKVPNSTKFEHKSDFLDEVNEEVLEWAQNKREEIEKLKQLESYRREFLGNVSHELKTPLFSIQGYLHTLLDGAIEDKEVNVRYIEKATKSVDRICTIVDDLEAISRLESGELELEMQVFDIHTLTQEVFDLLEMSAKEMNIILGFKKGSDIPFYVLADKERIREVLLNLVTNSIKYGSEGGATLVSFQEVNESIIIEVIDNGIGIEEKHLPRLFERFYRVDKSRSREQGGTGLGLSIVKHIIEAHHQSIHVISKVNLGSTFSFTLKKAKNT